jgi:hypothetical protein
MLKVGVVELLPLAIPPAGPVQVYVEVVAIELVGVTVTPGTVDIQVMLNEFALIETAGAF